VTSRAINEEGRAIATAIATWQQERAALHRACQDQEHARAVRAEGTRNVCCGSRNVPAHDTRDCGVNKNANALGHDARAAHREDVVPNPCHGRDMLQNRRTGTGTATSRACGRTTRPKACGELHRGRRDANAPSTNERCFFSLSSHAERRLDVPWRAQGRIDQGRGREVGNK